MKYTIAPLSLENINDLLYLYKAVFNNSISLGQVLKKYDTSYLGKSHFGHIAYHNGQPIAFHGAIPVLMQYYNDNELAAQYGDAMTLPNYNGKGLFTTLGKQTDKQLRNQGINFVWGFPNQNSEFGYLNKLEWNYVERMQCYKIKTSILPFEKIVRKFDLTTNLYEKHIANVFEKYKVNTYLNGSVFKSNSIVSTVRNKDYYTYKSFSNNFTIEIKGVLFWIKIKNGLLVGDVESSSKNAFNIALEKLKTIASKNGIGELVFQTSPDTFITQLMEGHNLEHFETWPVGYKNFSSNFPLERLKFTFGDLDTF